MCSALDVTPEGRLNGVISATIDPKYASSDGKAIVAFNIDGSVRWVRNAQKDAIPHIWDLDGDGRQDVILYDGPTMKLLDIDTGKVKVEKPTPACNEKGNRGGRENLKPYLPLYDMYSANVRGAGKGRDVVLKDNSTAFWVLNDKLDLVWWKSRENGHEIHPCDIDGDGCDEIMCDYAMFDHDGSEMWTMEEDEYIVHVHNHVDHMVIGEFDGNPDNGLEIGMSCSNSGFMLLDQEGRLRAHHNIGHTQVIKAGKFRDDIAGMQFLVGCRWGNPGTRVLFSGSGEKLWTIEPDNSRSRDSMLRWMKDRDLILIVSTIPAAGLYDGYGRKLLSFPDAELSVRDEVVRVGDFTGNGFDDFVIQAEDGLLVYTQGE